MPVEEEILDRIWRGSRPLGSDPLAEDRRAFIRALRERSRRTLVAAFGAAGAVAAGTIALGSGALRRGEPMLTVLLLPCWVALIALVHAEWQHRRVLPDLEGTIVEALRARLDRNRRARRRVRLLAALHATSLPLWTWGVFRLASTGRLAPGEVPSLVAVLAGLVLAAAAVLAHREIARLRPEANRLTELLRSYAG